MAALDRSNCASGRRSLAPAQADQAQGSGLMGWIALLVLAALSLGALRLLGLREGFLTASAAALLLGAAGYALQGSPSLPAAPAKSGEGHEILPLTDARHAFYGYFSPAEPWLR